MLNKFYLKEKKLAQKKIIIHKNFFIFYLYKLYKLFQEF
jgi:hypothetical protein